MELNAKLPGNLESLISNLARTREKAARQKYLLDLGESLVMHLCSFVLGEYKECGLTSIKLEKSFLNNSRNLGFGIYHGWLRDSSDFLNNQNKPSHIQNLLHGSLDMRELLEFIKGFEKLKELVAGGDAIDPDAISRPLKGINGKTNLISFFSSLVEFRNRVAHPHKEIKGKTVTWPFSEEYFDLINPLLENALVRSINELDNLWKFNPYIIDNKDEHLVTLKNEDSGEYEEMETQTNLPPGVRVLASRSKTILLADWKLLLKAGEEAIRRIRQEEDELRTKATVADLKESIRAALEDKQISTEEFNFFESLGKTRLGLSKDDLKKLITEVASAMNIEDPFPEVDKRFIEVIDQAINTRTYNEFLLKLTGQQYGVDNEAFEKIFLERTAALNADPNEVRQNKVLQFSREELIAFHGLLGVWKWFLSLASFKQLTKESIYKISGDSYVFGTKEYWHRTGFKALESFIQNRLRKLVLQEEIEWDTQQNLWQQGNLSSYAWCIIYPKNLDSKKMLALAFTLNTNGEAFIGYLPDWKDSEAIRSSGLLLDVFKEHLKSFAQDNQEYLKNYPSLAVRDRITERYQYSFTESMSQMPWHYDYSYYFDFIGFNHTYEEILNNPAILIEHFDITFNLFKSLFESVNRDYLNMIDRTYLINTEENVIRTRLNSLQTVLTRFGLAKDEPLNEAEEDPNSEKTESDSVSVILESDRDDLTSDGLSGSVRQGYFFRDISSRVKGFPISIRFMIRQDYFRNVLNYQIEISCAGYLQPDMHAAVEKVLESMQNLDFPGTRFYFKRSSLAVVLPIDDLDSFDAIPLAEFILNELALRCAESNTAFLSLILPDERLSAFSKVAAPVLDHLLAAVTEMFDNAIVKERDFMKGMRFLDLVSSTKKVGHQLGWGLLVEQKQIFVGITFHVSDSLKGAALMDQMKQTAKDDSSWKFISNTDQQPDNYRWILIENSGFKFSSSSDFNRNYRAHHALLSNTKTCWCAEKANDKQWWQVELDEAATIGGLKLTGSPNGKYFVSRFDLKYSTDGKNWNTINNLTGLTDATQINEIQLENTINARIIRIVPVEFHHLPGLRIDILAKKIVSSEIKLRWMVPVSAPSDIEPVFQQLPIRISTIKAYKGIGF